MTKPLKCAIYARVSTDDQTADNQIDDLVAWAASRGWKIAGVYQEADTAWRAGHQGELRRLREDARKGLFKLLLVWSLDRLSREGPRAALTWVDSLKLYGVRVLSYREPWTEVEGSTSELLYSITAWVARCESDRISERTRAGIARARASGIHCGRPTGSKDKKKRRSPRSK